MSPPPDDQIIPIAQASILMLVRATTDTPDRKAELQISGATQAARGDTHGPHGIRKLGIYRRRPMEKRQDVDKRMPRRESQAVLLEAGLGGVDQTIQLVY
jgi:hypothetical protein